MCRYAPSSPGGAERIQWQYPWAAPLHTCVQACYQYASAPGGSVTATTALQVPGVSPYPHWSPEPTSATATPLTGVQRHGLFGGASHNAAAGRPARRAIQLQVPHPPPTTTHTCAHTHKAPGHNMEQPATAAPSLPAASCLRASLLHRGDRSHALPRSPLAPASFRPVALTHNPRAPGCPDTQPTRPCRTTKTTHLLRMLDPVLHAVDNVLHRIRRLLNDEALQDLSKECIQLVLRLHPGNGAHPGMLRWLPRTRPFEQRGPGVATFTSCWSSRGVGTLVRLTRYSLSCSLSLPSGRARMRSTSRTMVLAAQHHTSRRARPCRCAARV